jgi:hypothetical protein
VLVGADWLYDKLHELFAGTYAPTPLHEFLASVPERLFRRADSAPRYQLIVTTNYDDALEKAFDEAGEPYHLVWYLAAGREHERGKFMHRAPGQAPVLIADPSEYVEASTEQCTVILKIHGAPTACGPTPIRTAGHHRRRLHQYSQVTIASLVPVGSNNSSAATSSSSVTGSRTGTCE